MIFDVFVGTPEQWSFFGESVLVCTASERARAAGVNVEGGEPEATFVV